MRLSMHLTKNLQQHYIYIYNDRTYDVEENPNKVSREIYEQLDEKKAQQ